MVLSRCYAQYSDHQLYNAYLERDMLIWEEYIVSANWQAMSVEEKIRMLNYEYGITAYMLGQDKDKARDFIARYEQHISDLQYELPKARYHAHLSSLNTYKLGINTKRLVKYASEIYDNIKLATAEDNKDAFVLAMQGNVEFYSPFGSKKKALEYYQQADSIYGGYMEEYERWNRCALRLTIVQCLIKHNKKAEAKKTAEQYLIEEPKFELMKRLQQECD